jgi:hypothetical protein
MTGGGTKRVAGFGMALALALAAGAGLVGCHKHHGNDDMTGLPQISYLTPTILATAGQPFTSVAPEVSNYFKLSGVGGTSYGPYQFTVSPELPANLSLDPDNGVISGTPQAAAGSQSYLISATDAGGTGTYTLTLGVLASTPVTLSYHGTGAVSTAVGAAMSLALPATPAAVTGGTAEGFGVSPALPSGLTLNAASGLVSGTPTEAIPATTFTLTVTTSQGSANCPFTLLVSASQPAAPSGLSYAALSGTVNLTVGTAMAAASPSVGGGGDLVYTVSPELPAGLSLDPVAGTISGTPTAAKASAPYTITASNAGGDSQATVRIVVS